jgi:hypothetical protein
MNNNIPFAHEPCAGIDKLTITTQDFTVRDYTKAGLTLDSGKINLDTGEQFQQHLFTDSFNREVFGYKAYYNDADNHTVNVNQYGLQVVFNPSKAYHPYKLCNDTKVLQERIETLEKQLRQKGIIFNMDNAKISRIDLAKNAQMNLPCVAYRQVLDALRIPRAKRNAMYPDGHSSNNNQVGLNIYNKGKELREKKILVINDDNTMRTELQYKSTKAVSDRTGIANIGTLIDIGIRPLNKIFNETLLNDIFKSQNDLQYPIMFENIKDMLIDLKKKSPSNAIPILFQRFGVEFLLKEVGSIDGFLKILNESGYHRNSLGNHRKRILKLIEGKSQFNDMKDSKSIGNLYKELKLKFAS